MSQQPLASRPLDAEGQAALDAAEARRGYLLPYHRMFAASAPALLEKYDAFYQALTLSPRVLTPYQKETVWASLLAAVREVHGFIHMKRAVAAGLGEADRVRAVAIAAATEAFATMTFAAGSWSAWTAGNALEAQYLAMFEAVRGDLDPMLSHLAALVCHGSRRDRSGTILHLRLAFAAGATPAQVCEGLSYMLIPCGGNTLIEAVGYWEDAAREGLVPAPY